MNHSMPDLPIHHQLLESTQIHVHRVDDAIQPSHPLSSPFPPALNLSQHQGLFQWVSSSHQVAKVLELYICIYIWWSLYYIYISLYRQIHTHTHTHTHIYIYIYVCIYMVILSPKYMMMSYSTKMTSFASLDIYSLVTCAQQFSVLLEFGKLLR